MQALNALVENAPALREMVSPRRNTLERPTQTAVLQPESSKGHEVGVVTKHSHAQLEIYLVRSGEAPSQIRLCGSPSLQLTNRWRASVDASTLVSPNDWLSTPGF